MSKKLRFIIALLLINLVMLSHVLAEPLQTVAVVLKDVGRIEVFDGVVEAVNQATLSAQTTGRVTQVLFDVDDFVNQGEIVVRLRDTQQQANLNKSKAAVNEAQASFEHAAKEFKRISSIFERKLVSKAQFDSAKAELDASRARLAAGEADLLRAREELERTVIRAPYAGIVVERFIEVGEMAQAGTPVMRGVGLNKLRVSIDVPQRLINAVRKLKQASVLLETSVGEQKIPAGNLTFFPYADQSSRSFKVRVDLPEQSDAKQNQLFPGMFVKVAFNLGENKQLLVPSSALVQRSEVSGVYVVSADNKISFRYVRPGRTSAGDSQIILAGLEPGEQVAINPLRAVARLKAGNTDSGSTD